MTDSKEDFDTLGKRQPLSKKMDLTEPLVPKNMYNSSPLMENIFSSDNSIASYGSMKNVNPHEGYALVFVVDSPQWKLHIERGSNNDVPKLVGVKKDESEHSHFLCIERTSHVEIDCPEDMLKKLRSVGFRYDLKYNHTSDKIVALISMPKEAVEEYADIRDIDVRIEPAEAVRLGRSVKDFNLAHRTYLDSDEEKTLNPNDLMIRGGSTLEKLPLELWKGIHIPFESAIDRKVYKQNEHGSILDNRLYLRILYDILTDDLEAGGADFDIPSMRETSGHPFIGIFAINGDIKERPAKLELKHFYNFGKQHNREVIRSIKNYYGELVAFYFAFLLHYTRWLLYLVVPGFLWFIVQVSVGKIDVPGTQVIIVIFLLWSTFMLENWYRREWKLRFRWGMMRYQQTEVPRPSFQGIHVVSEADGRVIEVYANKFLYYSKIFFSLSGIFFCLCIVITVVATIWTLKSLFGDKTEYSVLIGMINSIQITVFNVLYVYLAKALNDFEGHRLQQEWYNNLVIKRILFLIVNSFNSLFYLAFYKKRYDSNKQRLNAVRIQLVTLFVSMIFIQNFTEVLLPKLFLKFRLYSESKEHSNHKHENDNLNENNNTTLVNNDSIIPMNNEKLSKTNNDKNNDKIEDVEINIKDNKEEDKKPLKVSSDIEKLNDNLKKIDELPTIYRQLTVSDSMWEDAWDQLHKDPAPAVLDNVAEIVVQYGYIMLFAMIFPLMPLMAVVNNVIEFKLDYYNLLESQRGVPIAASGLGVWKEVMSAFSVVAVFTNMAIATYKSDLVSNLVGEDDRKQLVFFFTACFVILFFNFIVKYTIDDQTPSTKQAILRQEACEKYLLLGKVKDVARKTQKKKIEQQLKESKDNISTQLTLN